MVGMILMSAGMGTFYAPNNSSILSAVEPGKYGVISGFLNLVRNAGNLSGIAIGTVMVTTTMAALGHAPTLASVSSGGGESLLAALHLRPARSLPRHRRPGPDRRRRLRLPWKAPPIPGRPRRTRPSPPARPPTDPLLC